MPKQNKADLPSSTEEEVYVFTLLEHMGCSGKEAVAFTKSLFNMLSTPILEQIKSSHMQLESSLEAKMDAQKSSLEAKMDGLDAQNSSLEAKMDAQNSRLKAEMSHLRWFIGIVFAVLGGVLATVVALVAG